MASALDRGAEAGVTARLRLEAVAEAPDGFRSPVTRLAPYGVPTPPSTSPRSFPTGLALQSTGESPAPPPGTIRLQASLPGSLGATIELEVRSLNADGLEIDGAAPSTSSLEGLPPTSRLILARRQSDDPLQPGYHLYMSEPLSLIADLRASRAFSRSGLEDEQCERCEPPEDTLEILSGDRLQLRFPPPLRERLLPIYGQERIAAAQPELESVRWETSPAVRQEPALNPSLGNGDVAPGTLLHSGELAITTTDLFVQGRGLDFAFVRTHRTQTVGFGPLGTGGDHVYRQRLRELPNGDIEYYDGRGRVEVFKKQESGAFKAATGRFWQLARSARGWVLLDQQHNLVRFDRFGRLVSIADWVKDSERTGNELRFFHNLHSRLVRIRDTLDREYRLEYDEDGLLRKLRDFDGREVVYDYDAQGRLESARSPTIERGESPFPDGLTTRYAYAATSGDLAAQLHARDNLEAITDPKGQTWLELDYGDADGDGHADEVMGETWGGHSLTIAYDIDGGTTTVTDRRQHRNVYQHNAAGQCTRWQDPRGAVVRTEYNDHGLETRRTEPLGRVTETTYESEGPRRSQGNALSVRVIADSRGPNGSSETLTTTIEYETRTNQPTRITDPRSVVTEIERDDIGLAHRVTRAAGQPEASTTRYEYNERGQLTSLTNPNGHTTRYDYYELGPPRGYLQRQIVDPGGLELATEYEHDARGNVVSAIDPRRVRHETEYSEVDWVISRTRAAAGTNDGQPTLGYRTRYLYDRNGTWWKSGGPSGTMAVSSPPTPTSTGSSTSCAWQGARPALRYRRSSTPRTATSTTRASTSSG